MTDATTITPIAMPPRAHVAAGIGGAAPRARLRGIVRAGHRTSALDRLRQRSQQHIGRDGPRALRAT